MIPILLVNLFAAGVAALLPNEFLKWHSYLLYGFQFVTMVPYLLKRTALLQYLFLPTLFVLTYFLVNLTFGSYLVPRDFGWDKQFSTAALDIRHYNVIVPFLLLANIVLFVLSDLALRKLHCLSLGGSIADCEARGSMPSAVAKAPFFFLAFLAVSYNDVYSAFSFQLALVILHLTDPSIRRKWFRFAAYGFYLVVLAMFSYENKREMAMVLFLIVFLESYYARSVLRFTPGSIVAYVLAAGCFFGLVLAASIMRGYGDFPVASVIDALRYIPQYMTSEMFVDGLTDNLELNYNYGVTVASIDHGVRALIDYQYGASLIKVLFLPIPRDVLAFKPDSMMQLFTQVYAPEWWSVDGSMPVMFASDMFLNFHYLGLLPYTLIWIAINKLFVKFHMIETRSFLGWSCLFLFITVLMFARGSGIELWLLYYLLAAPVFFLFRLASNSVKTNLVGEARWVV